MAVLVEPGTEVIERASLPDPSKGFDAPDRLEAFLNAVRWGAITSADSGALQAPFRSGIEIEDYQLAPLVRALQMPRVNLLIADDVGLGKTIEAGLVLQELILRHRARTAMIVCPPNLCLKWQVEMREKFGLEFRIVDSSLIKELRRTRGYGVHPFTHFPRLIVSIDWVKLDGQMAALDEILPVDSNTYPRRFDMLIVDEAHSCAPPASGRYAVDSLRTKAIRRLAPHFEHRLFLSATPHNGRDESFQGLLALLDSQRFARGVEPSTDLLGQVMIRRLKSELRAELADDSATASSFPVRQIEAIPVDYPAAEAELHDELARYGRLLRAGARGDRSAEVASRFITLLLKKRLLSSPIAFANTLDTHIATLNAAARSNERVAAYRPAQLEAAFRSAEDDGADEASAQEAANEALAVAASASGPTIDEQSEASLARLRLRAMASKVKGRADAKTTKLIEWLQSLCCPGGVWNDERVIVFTEFRDTQEYLRTLLTNHGLGGDRLRLIYGSMDPAERAETITHFQYDPTVTPVRILLATDAASEGIDLQLFCHRIVHVEIPFSPTRLEQRNGRIDRHGQPSPTVEIYHFTGRDPDSNVAAADADFLYRIANKINEIRAGLGSANPVLEDRIQAAMTEGDRRLDGVLINEAAAKAQLRLKRIELDLRGEVAKLHQRLETSISDLGITPDAVRRVVDTALSIASQQLLVPIDHPAGSAFALPELTGSWARTIVGLADPLTQVLRPVTFDGEVSRGRTDVVHLHLGHPLVTKCLRLLRSKVWAASSGTELSRVSAQIADIEHVTVLARSRVVITGTDGRRLLEEVVTAGGEWLGGRLSPLNVGQTEQALRTVTSGAAPGHVCELLTGQWDRIRPPLLKIIEDRSSEVGRQRAGRLDAQREAEAAKVTEILTALESAIRRQLKEAQKPEQLDLFSSDERRQYDRDLDVLRRRLDSIPAEISAEQENLRRRHATRDVRSFPVAVTFLVPRSMAGAG